MAKRRVFPAVVKAVTKAWDDVEMNITFDNVYAENIDAILQESRTDHISYEIWVGDNLVAAMYDHRALAEMRGDA